ncbi:semaphorin-6B [Crotalus adamanteus]|uniref:Semaphorin-6B n=1 Tax=Crotalus adamanteus TaxID=8729 RepID=A0AAW1C362_CROAD
MINGSDTRVIGEEICLCNWHLHFHSEPAKGKKEGESRKDMWWILEINPQENGKRRRVRRARRTEAMSPTCLPLIFLLLLERTSRAHFPEESGPISVALEDYVKQYAVFVGNGPGRFASQEAGAERLHIQRMLTINRTLFIGERPREAPEKANPGKRDKLAMVVRLQQVEEVRPFQRLQERNDTKEIGIMGKAGSFPIMPLSD